MTIPRRLRKLLKVIRWTVTFQLLREIRERRDAYFLRRSPLFDSVYYAANSPDLRIGFIDVVRHYLQHGAREGRNPHPLFDTSYYLRANPDVADRGINPLVHFLQSGGMEGRCPHPLFNTPYYLEKNPFLLKSRINPLEHYLLVGGKTGRNPNLNFDSAWYMKKHPGLVEAGITPLQHYVVWGLDVGWTTCARANVERKADEEIDTAVVLHLYYTELWIEISALLQSLGGDFDLYVTLCAETAGDISARILEEFPWARILMVENRGRDIGPFFEVLKDERIFSYRYICKIHSKKSPHRVDGDAWRTHIYQQLLGDPGLVGEIKQVFDENEDVGIVGPATQLDCSAESWGSNREQMFNLVERMGLDAKYLKLEFFAGSMFWFRPSALEPLRNLYLGIEDFDSENAQLDGTLAHAMERVFPLSAKAAGLKIHPFVRRAARQGQEARNDETKAECQSAVRDEKSATSISPTAMDFKLIAFYLPQYHPIPENDEWWGKGFTEWTNVTKARPLFKGHIQPKLPTDLGFYDLRLPETRRAQAKLARQYGIHGFCYYYYWFDGKRLLERPLNDMLASGDPNFPFCICWANENWTRRWDGLEQEVLAEQTYSIDSSRRFIRDVIPILRDPRYIHFEGKPVLMIYRANSIPQINETVAMWRQECRLAGVGEIHLCAVRFTGMVDVHELGFDAAVDFPPHGMQVEEISAQMEGLDPAFEGFIYDYNQVVHNDLEALGKGYEHPVHRTVMLGWDNTARRGKAAHLAYGATPEAYKSWLTGVLHQEIEHNPKRESLVFINAWNEWAEGTVLEPDQHHGRGYLEATLEALTKFSSK